MQDPMNLAHLVGLHTLEAFGSYQEGSRPADWILNDIRIGDQSQFGQAGDIPGDMFATNAIDAFINFETVQASMDVVLTATNIGAEAAKFRGVLIGIAVDSGAREMLPMASAVEIPPGQTVQITVRPQRATFRPERLMIANNHEEHVILAFNDGLYDFSSYGTVVKIEDEERADAFLEAMPSASEPDLIFLRLYDVDLLYGVSERTGLVVFEAGTLEQRVFDDDDDMYQDDTDRPLAPRVVTKHFLRFDPSGFVPEWLPAAATDGN